MCGRIYVGTTLFEIIQRFDIVTSYIESLEPRQYTPMHPIAIIYHQPVATLLWANWGFTTNQKHPIIHARWESIKDRASFQAPFQYQRCIIPVTGFYEPDHRFSPIQNIFFQTQTSHLFALAGVFRYHSNNHVEVVIITVPSPVEYQQLESRFPLMITKQQEQDWLNPKLFGPALYPNMQTELPALTAKRSIEQLGLWD
ncbi:MAG: SOS response-associated peptidase family protein [Erysipelotrichaceae bacterium]